MRQLFWYVRALRDFYKRGDGIPTSGHKRAPPRVAPTNPEPRDILVVGARTRRARFRICLISLTSLRGESSKFQTGRPRGDPHQTSNFQLKTQKKGCRIKQFLLRATALFAVGVVPKLFQPVGCRPMEGTRRLLKWTAEDGWPACGISAT